VLVTGVGIGASWVLAEAWRCLPGWRWLEPRGR